MGIIVSDAINSRFRNLFTWLEFITDCNSFAHLKILFLVTSCFIGQSLALHALKRDCSALRVIDPEFGAGIHAEIKLRQVAIQVLVVHVLVDANEAALEDRKEAFERVGVHVAAHPFELGVVDRFVLRLGRHDEFVRLRAVGDEAALEVQVLIESLADVPMVQIHGADFAAALDQAEYLGSGLGIQRSPNGLTSLGGLGQIGLVSLNGDAIAADQPAAVLHGLANPMPEEPRGFHAAIEHALDLAGADAFLAGTHQMDDLQPQVQRQMAGFEDRAHADGKRLLAAVALAEAGPRGLTVQPADSVAAATMRADRTRWPEMRFDVREGSGFALELRGIEYGISHGGISYGCNSRLGA